MNTPIEPKDQDSLPQIDEQRRRLSKGGLAAPIVLGTLLSRPVLGAAPYNCTISGKLSGNTSSHGQPVSCAIGKSHGFWKNTTEHLGDWGYASLAPDDLFTKPGFSNQYPNSNSGSTSKTMLEVLDLGGGAGSPPYEALGREAVCAYLNAFRFAPDFPLTGAEVVSIFNTTVANGQYIPIPGATPWSPEVVKNYFESLHDS